MTPNHRSIALRLIEKFKPYEDVEFVVDVWEGNNQDGWGVRVYWTDPDLKDAYPKLRLDGIFYHATNQADAEAVVEAIEHLTTHHLKYRHPK